MKPISPRSGAKKTAETAVDLTVLALVAPFIVSFAQSKGVPITAEMVPQAVAAVVAVGGVIARGIHHVMVYGFRGR